MADQPADALNRRESLGACAAGAAAFLAQQPAPGARVVQRSLLN